MELGRFYVEMNDNRILHILSGITGDEIKSLRQVCERYGFEEAEVRRYDVYEVECTSGKKVLKKTGAREAFNYEAYLVGRGFSVPEYYGKYIEGDVVWILVEAVQGNELRNMTDNLAIACADCLAKIQNEYWMQGECAFRQRKTDDRFEAYWERVLKRAASIEENEELKKVYQLFLDRQLVCPRTLAHGDFLQFNVMHNGEKITIVDWGFGGIMPYSLDIARFIAHATETASTFPFYMTDEQKRLFIDRVYKMLSNKPDYEQYLVDIRLAVFNEYIEFIEAEEDEDQWYFHHALLLAEDILQCMAK